MNKIKKNSNKSNKDPLINMLNAATKTDLIGLIKELIEDSLSTRRMCIDYLKERVVVNSSIHDSAESSAILTMWYEIEPDLSELDAYGGGDYHVERNVRDTLYKICEKLNKITLTEEDKEELLNEVLSYIKSGNAGMDDDLYDVAYTICKNDSDLRDLAKRFENLKQSWPIEHARRIYRKIGDHKEYLRLRLEKMHSGMDYYDLSSFYWEIGEKQKAIDTAQKGMKLAKGRLSDLRMFLAKRAKEAGDRGTYLDYYFVEKTNPLTLSSYNELEKECQKEEWRKYEPKILNILKEKFDLQAVKIYLHRKEYEAALQYFKKNTANSYSSYSEVFSVAEKLEARYPEEILRFYKSGIGNLNVSRSRKIYAQNAVAVKRVRRVLVDVMKKPDEWKKFAIQIKANNANRPAFQDEFAKVISDWNSL